MLTASKEWNGESFDRRSSTARDGPLSRHSEKISIDQIVRANMASSEIAEYGIHAGASRRNVASHCIVLFNGLISHANISFYRVPIAYAITLLLLSERYIILMLRLAYVPICGRGLQSFEMNKLA